MRTYICWYCGNCIQAFDTYHMLSCGNPLSFTGLIKAGGEA